MPGGLAFGLLSCGCAGDIPTTMSANDGITGYLTDPYVGVSVLDELTCMTGLGEESEH